MPDLETLLRDVKPAPDPAWTLKLDTRVAHRFPQPPSRRQRLARVLRAHLGFVTAGVVVTSMVAAMVVVALGSYTQTSSDTMSTSARDAMVAMESEASSGGSSTPEIEEASGGRAVKASASLTLTTTPDRVQGLTNRSITIVDQLGGYVQSSEIDEPSPRRAVANLSLRIPSADLDTGLARLSKLANVQARTQQTEDLTDRRETLEAAVRDARADREGLRARLEQATTDRERSRLRALLDRSTRRVTQRTREVNELGRDVSYATVDLEIRGTRSAGGAATAPNDRWTPGDALGDAVRVLEVIAGVALIALAIILPIVAIGVLAWIAGRILTRRRRERALEVA